MGFTRLARPRWDRGEREAGVPAWRSRLLPVLGVAVVLVALVVSLASMARGRVALLGGGETPASLGAGSTIPRSSPGPSLADTPTIRFALGFLELDDPLARAVAVLGPADRRQPDINDSETHTWVLGEATVDVTADAHGIFGLGARVPAGSPARVAVHGDVVIGESTPRDVVAAWGKAYTSSQHDSDDYALSYTECLGPAPVVVKFGQDHDGAGAAWDAAVTSVFISYADADPGTHGCGGRDEA